MKYLTIKLEISDYYQVVPLAQVWAAMNGYKYDNIESLLADYFLSGNGKHQHKESPTIEE